jgi:hypothetical protein
MTIIGQDGGDGGVEPRSTGGLPQALVDVLAAQGDFARNFCRMQAKVAGYPLLWQPRNPRWWWGIPMFVTALFGPASAVYLGKVRNIGLPAITALLLVLGPGAAAVICIIGIQWALQRRERRHRVQVSVRCEPHSQVSQEDALVFAVRYAISRVGGFDETLVRPDERSATFMRMTLIGYPLLHEFSYYVSEKLGQIDAMALGDFLAERRRRTIADLAAGVQEYLQTKEDHGDE